MSEEERTAYYKVLGAEGEAIHGGTGKWNLPENGEPGAWMPKLPGPIIACERGYHLCVIKDVLSWIKPGASIFLGEGRGESATDSGKIAFSEARLLRKMNWDARTERLFAADCAEHVLPLYEKRYPDDAGPREAIAAARRFARGEITEAELIEKRAAADAAAHAAYAAADAAADAAAYAAAHAAYAAAYAAAADAADAEREWQGKRLIAYLSGKVRS